MSKNLINPIISRQKNRATSGVSATPTEPDLSGLSPLSQEIFREHKVRRTNEQKQKFINLLEAKLGAGVDLGEDNPPSRNIIVGNIETAKVIFSAHYDTPMQLRIPIVLFPKNILLKIIVLVVALICCFAFIVLTNSLINNSALSIGIFLCVIAAIVFLAISPIPNPINSNDNTSGIITLCEIISSLTEEKKEAVAFIFFDNEERNCKGSKLFSKLHKSDGLKDKLLINFDCVADGNHLFFALKRKAYSEYSTAFLKAFNSNPEAKNHLSVQIKRACWVKISSDQRNFERGVGVVALHKFRVLGYYLPRIHTPRDTEFQKENIYFLVDGIKRLLKEIS